MADPIATPAAAAAVDSAVVTSLVAAEIDKREKAAKELAEKKAKDLGGVIVLGTPAEQLETKGWGFNSVGDYVATHARYERGHKQHDNFKDERFEAVKRAQVAHKAAFSTISQDSTSATAANQAYGGTVADGGFAVPQIITDIKAVPLYSDGVLERISKVVHPGPGNVLTMPFDASAYEWATSGQVVYRTAENSTLTPTKIAGLQRQVQLFKYTELLPLTDEVISDTIGDLANHMIARGASKMRYAQTYDTIQGAGTNQAEGFLNANAAVTVNRQTAGHFQFIDAAKMRVKLAPQYYSGAFWLISSSVLADLFTMAFDASATSKFPVFLPFGGGMAAGQRPDVTSTTAGFLLDLPVLVSAAGVVLGTKGDVMLVNGGEYMGFYKSGSPNIAQSIHYAFADDVTVLRLTQRYGGMNILKDALIDSGGTGGTTSNIVLLN